MDIRTGRTDDGVSLVSHTHYAAPRLAEEQGREALSIGLDLQEAAITLDPVHAREYRNRCARRRVVRLSLVVFALEAVAGLSVANAELGWWPTLG